MMSVSQSGGRDPGAAATSDGETGGRRGKSENFICAFVFTQGEDDTFCWGGAENRIFKQLPQINQTPKNRVDSRPDPFPSFSILTQIVMSARLEFGVEMTIFFFWPNDFNRELESISSHG